MPSIAEATSSNPAGLRRRLALGVGCVSLGGVFIGFGVMGAVAGVSGRTAVVAGGASVLLGLWITAVLTAMEVTPRSLVSGGAALGLASALLFWAAAEPAVIPGFGSWEFVTGVGILVGLAIELAALVAGVTGRSAGRLPGDTAGPVAWTRTDRGPGRNPTADGGNETERSSSDRE